MELDRKSMLKLLIPVMIDQVFITLLPMVNTIIVSMLGQASMSGVSIIDQVNQLVAFTVVAIGMGAAIMVAQYMGKNDPDSVKRVIKQSYSSSLLIAAVATLVMLLGRDFVIGAAMKGAVDEMLTIGKTYLTVTCLSYPLYCFYSNSTQVLRSLGEPRKAMYMSIIMNTSQMVISLICIYGFQLGIYGAAYASLGGRLIGALLGYYFMIKTGVMKGPGDFFTIKLEWATQKMLIRFGVPAGMQSFFFVGARLVMNRFILPYGTDHITANVVYTQILDLQCTGSTFVAMMAPAIMGMAKGRGDQDGMKRAFKDLHFYGFWFGALFAIVPIFLTGVFSNIYNLAPATAEIASKMIRFNPLYVVPLVWFAQVAPACFRGIGDTLVPPLIMSGSLWAARVTTIAVLCTYFNMGAYASYFAVMNDYIVRTVLYFWRYKSGAWLRAQTDVEGAKA